MVGLHSRHRKTSIKIETEGICLLCLNETSPKDKQVSLKFLLRHLEVDVLNLNPLLSSIDGDIQLEKFGGDVLISVCDRCDKLTERFSNEYMDFEVARLKLEGVVKEFVDVMEAGGKDDVRMEVMKTRMRKSKRTLTTAAFAENLRKETLWKGSCKVKTSIPRLKLRRIGDKSGGGDQIGTNQDPVESAQPPVSCSPGPPNKDVDALQNSAGVISTSSQGLVNANPPPINDVDAETLIQVSKKVPPNSECDGPPASINSSKDESSLGPIHDIKPDPDRLNPTLTCDNFDFVILPIIVTEDELLEFVTGDEMLETTGYQPDLENAMDTSVMSPISHPFDVVDEDEEKELIFNRVCLTCGTLLTDSTCPLCEEKQSVVDHDIKIYTGLSSLSPISIAGALSTSPTVYSASGPRLVSAQTLWKRELKKKKTPRKRKSGSSKRANPPRPRIRKKTRYQCSICPKSFAGSHNLKHHISKEHAGEPPSIHCSFCEKKFYKIQFYRNHQLAKHAFQTLKDALPLGTTEKELQEAMEGIAEKILRFPEDKKSGCGCPYCGRRRGRASDVKSHILSGHLSEVINIIQRNDVHSNIKSENSGILLMNEDDKMV